MRVDTISTGTIPLPITGFVGRSATERSSFALFLAPVAIIPTPPFATIAGATTRAIEPRTAGRPLKADARLGIRLRRKFSWCKTPQLQSLYFVPGQLAPLSVRNHRFVKETDPCAPGRQRFNTDGLQCWIDLSIRIIQNRNIERHRSSGRRVRYDPKGYEIIIPYQDAIPQPRQLRIRKVSVDADTVLLLQLVVDEMLILPHPRIVRYDDQP